MYGVFVEGLRKAGIAEEHLKFFRLHMEVDDEHAITLEQLMASYAGEPGWLDGCARAADEALTLRARFFDNLYEGVRHRRVQGKLAAIQDRGSLAPPLGEGTLVHHNGEPLEVLYENVIDRLNIAFDVLRLPFRGETIDPRIVRIAPYKNNEKHKHAHETLYYILSGRGRITIDDHVLEVSAGDLAFVPRWSLHQTQNLTGGDMIVLAVTDANLTDIAYVGRQNPRLKGAAERG
jgi:mannose-6-phosphate isomerase-like protein (cupin superfamily)